MNPIDPNPPIQPPITPPSNDPIPPPSGPNDTLGSSSVTSNQGGFPGGIIPLPLPQGDNLTILAYNQILDIVKRQAQQNQYAYMQQIVTMSLNQLAAHVQPTFTEILNAIKDQNALGPPTVNQVNGHLTTINRNISDLNNQIGTDTHADQYEVDRMNKAIQDYNNGVITQTEFNNDVANYNDFIQTRNNDVDTHAASFNDKVDGNNQLITSDNQYMATQNEERTLANFPPYPQNATLNTYTPVHMGPPIDPNNPPASVSMPAPSPVVQQYTLLPPPVSQGSNFFGFDTLIFIEFQIFAELKQQQNLQFNTFDNLVFRTRGQQVNVPSSYIREQPPSFVKGSGNALSSQSSTGDSAVMMSVLQTLFRSKAKKQTYESLRRVTKRLNGLGLTLLSQSGLAAALPTLSLLNVQGKGLPPASAALSTALVAFIAKQISGLVKSDALLPTIKQLVANEASLGNLSEADQSKLIDALGASLNLSLLVDVLTAGALSLGLPGFLPQLLGNSGSPLFDEAIFSTTNKSHLDEILNNPISIIFLKAALANQLGPNSEAIVNNVLNAILEGVIPATPEQLSKAVEQALIKAGISPEDASAAGKVAAAFIENEKNFPLINSTFNKNVLNNVLNPLASSLNLSEANKQSVNNALTKASADLQHSVEREFLDKFVKALQEENFSAEDANAIAQKALEFIETGNISAAFKSDQVRKDILNNSLIKHLNANGVQNADTVASNAINAVLAETFANEAEFRQGLDKALQNQGVAVALSSILSQEGVIRLSQQKDALLSSLPDQKLSLSAFREQLTQKIVDQLSPEVGAKMSSAIAALFVNSVAGQEKEDQLNPTSLIKLVRDEVKKLETLTNVRFDEKVQKAFQNIIKPSYDFASFIQSVLDPGKSLFLSLSMGYGAEISSVTPKNFKREVEFQG